MTCRSYFLGLRLVVAAIVATANHAAITNAEDMGWTLKIDESDNTAYLDHSNGDKLKVGFCNENIIHVKYTPKERLSAPEILQNKPCPSVETTKFEDPSGVTIRTNQVELRIDRARETISVLDLTGTPLLRQGSFDMLSGFSLDHPSEQAFYGAVSYPSEPAWGVRPAGLLKLDAGDHGHAAAPFVWTTKGYGVVWNADGGTVNLLPNLVAVNLTTPIGANFYIIVGTPAEIFSGVSGISGRSPMLPKFTLGFMQSEWGINEAELVRDVETYRKKKIPLDVFFLDYDWFLFGQDDWGDFHWNTDSFPSGADGTLLKRLNDQLGVKVATIRKPSLRPATIQWEEAKKLGFIYSVNDFLDRGTKVFGKWTHGKYSSEFNFSTSAAREWWWEHSAPLLTSGIWGYWNDENEGYQNFRTTEMQRTYYEGERREKNRRVWSLNRNFYLGAQRYGFISWPGDLNSVFDDMATQRASMINTISLGQAWWSMDVGGFRGLVWWLDPPSFQGLPSYENYARWMQFGAFVPVFRIHGRRNNEREPWKFGPDAEAVARKYINLRYQLLPYLYSLSAQYSAQGLPMIRPMYFQFPEDPSCSDLFSQWMVGDSILVSPVVEQGVKKVSVYLPSGRWIDYWTHAVVTGPATIDYQLDGQKISDIPIFIREGAIIPQAPPMDYVGQVFIDPLRIDLFPTDHLTTFEYYDDDGVSYDYEKGIFYKVRFSLEKLGNTVNFSTTYLGGDFSRPFKQYELHFNLPAKSDVRELKAAGVLLKKVPCERLTEENESWCRTDDNKKTEIRVISKLENDSLITFDLGR